jgi:hypothetical protein
MQLWVRKELAAAVSTVMMNWMMVFQVLDFLFSLIVVKIND